MHDLHDVIELVSDDKKGIAERIVDELEFMDRTLKALKLDIDENGPVELFVNGKQKMLRDSPALKGYSTLIQRYATLSKQLVDMLPRDAGADEDELDRFISRGI